MHVTPIYFVFSCPLASLRSSAWVLLKTHHFPWKSCATALAFLCTTVVKKGLQILTHCLLWWSLLLISYSNNLDSCDWFVTFPSSKHVICEWDICCFMHVLVMLLSISLSLLSFVLMPDAFSTVYSIRVYQHKQSCCIPSNGKYWYIWQTRDKWWCIRQMQWFLSHLWYM